MSGAPFTHLHRVRFQEIDAAGIAYFARFFTWCHDAMEAMLEDQDNGYVVLITRARIGLPAVHVDADFASPLRYGDTVHIDVVVERLGRSSVTLRFDMEKADDKTRVATVRHVVVTTDLDAMRSRPMPDDLRARFERHRAADPPDAAEPR